MDYYQKQDRTTEAVIERLSDPFLNIKLFLKKVRQSLSKTKQRG